MHYLIYQITNMVNGKIYIGAHRTSNIDDGYMGSGKLITRALKKYGEENFTKTILFEAESSEEMFEKEAELVQLGPNFYNLKKGGEGGFDYINENGLRVDFDDEARQKAFQTLEEKWGPNWGPVLGKLGGKAYAKVCKEKGYGFYNPAIRNLGSISSQSEESRAKRIKTFEEIDHQQGVKNSQFETMWITNGIENKKIRKEDPIPEGWSKGRKMKSIKCEQVV